MLTKFSVSNFKGFNQDFVFDFSDTNGYEFNKSCVKNGIVNNALIYGHNGVGKSNLGFAIFDIIGHLTDKKTIDLEYAVYLNALNPADYATFRFEFLIEGHKIVYEYRKKTHKEILSEYFEINGKTLAMIDRRISHEATFYFEGAENLRNTVENVELSILKYVKNNSVLEPTDENLAFLAFFKFVETMLFFRSVHGNMYLGLEADKIDLAEDIIKKGNVKDFEQFLNKAGIECNLTIVREFDKDILAFDFEGKVYPFFKVASHGTKTLILFYFWLQRIRENGTVSFLFVDEFDAFYHHELSILIIEELKKTGVQFILTTHNTSNISNDLLRPDCYFLMYKQFIRSLAKSTSKELREAHNIEKMYKAGSFNA